MRKCIFNRAALAAVALGTLLAGCSRQPQGNFQGYLDADFLYIAAPVAGRVEELPVARGGNVRKGELLFRLEPEPERALREEASKRLAESRSRLEDLRKGSRPSEIDALEARLGQAESDLTLAEINLARRKELVATKVIPQEDYDRAASLRDRQKDAVAEIRAQLVTAKLGGREDAIRVAEGEIEAAAARLAQADWSFTQKQQLAPEDALVVETLYRTGERVAANQPVVQILPPRNLKIRFFVPPAEVSRLRMGDAVAFQIAGTNEWRKAAVNFIGPWAEYTPPVIYSRQTAHKLVYAIEARPVDPDPAILHPGQPVEVRLK